MSHQLQKLLEAQKHAFSIKPKVGGFPVLAEVLRLAGVDKNIWTLPSCQSIYLMNNEAIVQQGTPLVTGTFVTPKFNQEKLIKALRADQAGHTSFPEFLKASWEAGVTGYEVDFHQRWVKYFGALGESYLEVYPKVEVSRL